MSNDSFRTTKPADTFQTHSLQTGIAPVGSAPLERQVSQKEKVEIWFSDPLRKLEGDDGFVCLLICFPLIETVVRYELGVPDDVDLKFSDNSPALKWVAEFLTIPEAKAREVWDALRNGLMHRGMIKSATSYVLTGEKAGRPAEFNGDVLRVYVWELRDRVVDLLRKHHKRLWNDGGCLLPRITVTT
jgi:hypothetical protein